MFCSISGTVPEHPVVSKVTGQLYEKTLIEKYVQENGRDPITGDATSVEDLLELKASKVVKPRPTPATSIPGLLGLFHNEWDALMLETHTLRQNLNTVRQELSHALYQHDAACRVIARLTQERDAARSALQNVQVQLSAQAANGAAAEEVEEPASKKAKTGITEDVIAKMNACSATLSKGRKKRAVPPGTATPEQLDSLSLLGSYPVHKTTQGGILAIDISPDNGSVVATAGADSTVQLFDTGAAQLVASLNGHTKKVTDVKFIGNQGVVVSTSNDKTTRVWQAGDDGYKCSNTFTDHGAEVVGATLHPTKEFLVTASADKTWCFYDLAAAVCLTQVQDASIEAGYSCVQFHPDGLILGTGTQESVVRIWDVRQQTNVARFEGHSGSINSLCFSENGYYFATSASDGIKLWDLRKVKNFKTLTPYEGAPTSAVVFDYSGQYLACGGEDARVYGVKQDWSVVKTFSDMPKKGVYSVAFGADAKSLFVGAADHNLRLFGISNTDNEAMAE